MGDEKSEMLDIAAGGTGEGKEHQKLHPKKEAETPKEKQEPKPKEEDDGDDAA